MDENTTYKVSAKRADTGKFWQFGNLKHNAEYGNWRMGVKVTPELKALIAANDGKWLNFSLFAENEKKEPSAEAKEGIKQLEKAVYDDSSDIPF